MCMGDIEEYYGDDIKSGTLDLDKVVEFKFNLDEMTLNDIRYFLAKNRDIEDNFGLFKINGNFYQIIY